MKSVPGLILISDQPAHQQRLAEFSQCYQIPYKWATDWKSLDKEDLETCALLILSNLQNKKVEEIPFSGSIIFLVDSSVPCQQLQPLKGNDSILLLREKDFFTSKLEFLIDEAIQGAFFSVPSSELKQGRLVSFTLYHRLPLNQKYISVVPAGTVLSDTKMQKLVQVADFYVRRRDSEKYRLYLEDQPDFTEKGQTNLWRAQFLSLNHSYSQFVQFLIDAAEENSFSDAKWLWDRCSHILRDTLKTSTVLPSAGEHIRRAIMGDFGTLQRASGQALYAGLFSQKMQMAHSMEVMQAALLGNLGMLEMAPEITRKLRQDLSDKNFSDQELERFRRLPNFSLNYCNVYKLPVNESIRSFVANSHERIDRKGFPLQPFPEKIPREAMLLQFVELLDLMSLTEYGRTKSLQALIKNMVYEHEKDAKVFSGEFLRLLPTEI